MHLSPTQIENVIKIIEHDDPYCGVPNANAILRELGYKERFRLAEVDSKDPSWGGKEIKVVLCQE